MVLGNPAVNAVSRQATSFDILVSAQPTAPYCECCYSLRRSQEGGLLKQGQAGGSRQLRSQGGALTNRP